MMATFYGVLRIQLDHEYVKLLSVFSLVGPEVRLN